MSECVSEDMQVCNWSLDDSVYEEDVRRDGRILDVIGRTDRESVTTECTLLHFVEAWTALRGSWAVRPEL